MNTSTPKIFLVGMPGSGKTTLGRKLAEELRTEFVDLDAEIEKSVGKAITEIFAQQGEDYFRQVEARLLREWAGHSVSFVMATGGGAPCFHQGIETINEYGLSVFLDCSVSELVERVKANKERPLLLVADEASLREKLERMRDARLSCYQKASIVLQNPSLDQVLEEIRLRM